MPDITKIDTKLDEFFQYKQIDDITYDSNNLDKNRFSYIQYAKQEFNFPEDADGMLQNYTFNTQFGWQLFYSNTGKVFMRTKVNGEFQEWKLINEEPSINNIRVKFNSNNSATFLSDNEDFWFNPETISGNVTISNFYFGNGNTSNLANIYCNTLNAKNKLIAQGEIISSGDITAFSDIRLKTNIEKIDNALDKIMQISGYTYNMNNKRSTGVIAQEVEKVLPEVVQDREDGYKTVAYGNMIGLLVEAIKELKQEIEVLKNGVI